MAKPGPDHKLRQALAERARAGSLRQLSSSSGGIDFCSNDYLGMARSHRLRTRIDRTRAQHPHASLGSTGSRLISGNSETAERLEARLAAYHRAESGLLFGSGYAANSGLLACIAGPGDTLIMDELIHASSIDGWPAAQPLSAWSRCTRWAGTWRLCRKWLSWRGNTARAW